MPIGHQSRDEPAKPDKSQPARGARSPATALRWSVFFGEEDVLDLGVGVEGAHAELAAEAGLLVAAEGRLESDRAVGVDRERAGAERPGDADGTGGRAGPEGARE